MTNIMIIENVTILTMNANRDIIDNGAVIIEDNKIIDVGDKSII